MINCYVCGAAIRRNGARREVYLGRFGGVRLGRSLSVTSGKRYGIRTVCDNCAMEIDDAKARRKQRFLAVWLVAFIVFAGFIALGFRR